MYKPFGKKEGGVPTDVTSKPCLALVWAVPGGRNVTGEGPLFPLLACAQAI